MIKQEWMEIVAGEALVDAIAAETKAKCRWTGYGYASDDICALQQQQAARGIIGVEIVKSNYGFSVRYDSGLQNFGLVASARRGELDGSYEAASAFCREWVNRDAARRYAWTRKAVAVVGPMAATEVSR